MTAENGVASISKSLCCSIAHHTTFTRSPCCTQRSWWMTESSPEYASPRGEDPEGRMTELVNAKRWCLMKNTERKDLGDHLSIYPKNMFDEAIEITKVKYSNKAIFSKLK